MTTLPDQDREALIAEAREMAAMRGRGGARLEPEPEMADLITRLADALSHPREPEGKGGESYRADSSHLGEGDEAKAFANRILDNPNYDPDGELSVLARQYLRNLETSSIGVLEFIGTQKLPQEFHLDERATLDFEFAYIAIVEAARAGLIR